MVRGMTDVEGWGHESRNANIVSVKRTVHEETYFPPPA